MHTFFGNAAYAKKKKKKMRTFHDNAAQTGKEQIMHEIHSSAPAKTQLI